MGLPKSQLGKFMTVAGDRGRDSTSSHRSQTKEREAEPVQDDTAMTEGKGIKPEEVKGF